MSKLNLRNKFDFFSWNYNLLTFGNMTSKLGAKIYSVILMFWLVDMTNSAKYVGYVTAASMIPIIIFNLFGGAIVDRFNKKNILITCDLISSLVCILISYFAYREFVNPYIIITASFVLGACDSMFIPTVKSILPEIVDSEYIEDCNSLTSIINQFMRVLGPLIGGVLLNKFSLGVAACFFINGISYLISGISEVFIKYNFINTRESTDNKIFEDLFNGYKYIIKNKWLTKLILSSCIINIFLASYNILLPLYYKNIYNQGALAYSQALSFEALGGVIAGVSFLAINKKKDLILRFTKFIVLIGISLIIIQFTSFKYVSLTGAFLLGYSLTKFNIMQVTIIQNNIDKNFTGRVFSFLTLASLSIMPISNIVFGYFDGNILNYIFIISGLFIIASSLVTRSISINNK